MRYFQEWGEPGGLLKKCKEIGKQQDIHNTPWRSTIQSSYEFLWDLGIEYEMSYATHDNNKAQSKYTYFYK